MLENYFKFRRSTIDFLFFACFPTFLLPNCVEVALNKSIFIGQWFLLKYISVG